jgi:hypothetical protein
LEFDPLQLGEGGAATVFEAEVIAHDYSIESDNFRQQQSVALKKVRVTYLAWTWALKANLCTKRHVIATGKLRWSSGIGQWQHGIAGAGGMFRRSGAAHSEARERSYEWKNTSWHHAPPGFADGAHQATKCPAHTVHADAPVQGRLTVGRGAPA